MENERCINCKTGQKISLYKKVGEDLGLARQLAKNQNLDKYTDNDLLAHYPRTAQTLELGCKMGILCEKEELNPCPQPEWEKNHIETERVHLGRPVVIVDQGRPEDFLRIREQRLIAELEDVRKMLRKIQTTVPKIDYNIYK